MSVSVLGLVGEKLYILRKFKFDNRRRIANLLQIANDEKKQCVAIKNLSRLLRSSNTKHHHQLTALLPELPLRIPQQRVQEQTLGILHGP